MLLPLLIPIAIALLFIIFYKRPVNAAGTQWTPPVRIDPPTAPQQPSQSAAPAPAVAPVDVPMNFNDIFGGKPSQPTR